MSTYLGLDLSNVKPATGTGEPIPAGWYDLRATESSVDMTKDNSGRRLNVKMEVVNHPQYSGRIVYHGFNIQNSNPKAVEIAMAELSALAHAVGCPNVQDSQQLHNIPFKARVVVKTQEGYDPKNEIKSFQHITYNPHVTGGAPGASVLFASAPATHSGQPAFVAPAPAPTYVAPPAHAPAPPPAPPAPQAHAMPTVNVPPGYQLTGYDVNGQPMFAPIAVIQQAPTHHAPPVNHVTSQPQGDVPWAS